MRSDWLDSTLKRTAASVKWAVNGSFSVNLCLFVIQTFAAILHGLAGPLRSRDRCIHGSSFVRGHHAHHFADGRPYLNLTNIPWDSAGPKRLWIRRYPAAHIFFIDHSNGLAVNIFGLIMSILGDRFAWYLDPIGGHLHCAPHPLLLGRNRVRQRLAAGWQDCATRSLQRKLGGLASVERAFDHADHEDTHNPMRSTNRYILPLGRRGEPFERG
ncbi:hypothetical protein RJZ90_000224 [Blastomyces dermatitidis]